MNRFSLKLQIASLSFAKSSFYVLFGFNLFFLILKRYKKIRLSKTKGVNNPLLKHDCFNFDYQYKTVLL
jgi:hypothetical protein